MDYEGVPAESISNIDLDVELRHRNSVQISRPFYSEDEFRKNYEPKQYEKQSFVSKLKSWLKPDEISKKAVKRFVFSTLPILEWLPKYGLKKQLLPDIISGFTVGIYRLPQGMAHAILATVPPVYGLYTVFFPVIIYCFFGTSKHISTDYEGVPAESISNIDRDVELRHRNSVQISRPFYSEDEFRKNYEPKQYEKQSFVSKLKSWLKPDEISKKAVKRFVFSTLPILEWLPKYGLKKQLLPDIISGFTVGIYRLPQGSFAVVSIMTGDAADKVIKEISKDKVLSPEEEEAARIQAVVTLALMVGIIQIILGILHFGILSDYLPEPLIRGFTTGAAVHVFTSQFNKMFGISLEDVTGPLSIFRQYVPFFPNLRYVNTTEIIASLISIILMVVVKEVQEKFKKTYQVFKYPIPVELLVIILGTLVSYYMEFETNNGVSVVGSVPTG
ncbi:Pendrin [Holothuria leucospilota]|uniref:Pendrin n=1 Tax=Holothuria leucospilota TaxID=206669 RepID=A0A9Q1CKE5_HOLLE|nr:Pendrin [Holothuria leucospilota]